MDKSFDRHEKHSSEKLINRIISRFRMVKREAESNMNTHVNIKPSDMSNIVEKKNLSDETNIYSGTVEEHILNRKVSLSDVLLFCGQLDKFVTYLKSVRDLNYLTDEYPNVLQKHVDASASELEGMLVEVKSALTNVEQLKKQHKMIKTEKNTVRKLLKRIKDNEIREMEYIISLYDKTMFSRWENVKNTTKSDVLEGMLSDIKGKQFALENLSMLVTRKLDHLRIYVPLTSSTEKNSPRKEKSIIPLPFPSFSVTPNNELSKISLRVPPPPPPLPSPPSMSITSSLPQPLPTSISLISQHGKKAQRLSVQKRRRSERREENGEHSHTAVNINEILLTPLSSSGLSHHTVFDTNNNSNSGMASQNNIASTRGRSGIYNISLINNINSNGYLGTELRTEMQTVLEALFGDLRTRPTLLVTESNSSNTNIESSRKYQEEN